MSRWSWTAAAALAGACATTPVMAQIELRPAISRIAFGSCYSQDGPDTIWQAINGLGPEVFLFLGDNVYADTEDMAEMRRTYARLGAVPGFQTLRADSVVLATWDDHDFGANDAGREYPRRDESQRIFLDFWGEPLVSERRSTPGVYDAETFGPPGRRVQFILLDTRYFRDALDRGPRDRDFADGRAGDYVPTTDTSRTMLGEAQWAWLEARLREPAEVRLIASSIQVVAEDHGWETWATMPHERSRLLRLIRETGARGVVFLSGDRHKAELSRLAPDAAPEGPGYPLYDLTSSALNRPSQWYNEVNRHRVGSDYHGANFGTVAIDWWAPGGPRVALRIHREDGAEALREVVPLSALTPPASEDAAGDGP